MSARRRLLVAAPRRELVDNPHDGFAVRHRSMVTGLLDDYDVCLVVIGEPDLPNVDLVGRAVDHATVTRPPAPHARTRRLWDAGVAAAGVTRRQDREFAYRVTAMRCDAAVTIGPWLQHEFGPVWRSLPTVHLFEEELTTMAALAPQSSQARALRALDWRIRARGPSRPSVVVAISDNELGRARARYGDVEAVCIPFGLSRTQWPAYDEPAEGDLVLAVGNFAEERNAAGLALILDELRRRGSGGDGPTITVVTGPGTHPCLADYLAAGDLARIEVTTPMHEVYRSAAIALVPATQVTGQKTTILQAWACGVPVVASAQSAATVSGPGAMVVGHSPVELVDHLQRLLGSPDERSTMAGRGFAVVEQLHTAERQQSALLISIESVVGTRAVDAAARQR